ncbi:MAG TPA: MATE family efflux transporter [Spirochaetia bacterium]|nr:MATE family efflux transporter [Spirochaetia bacterium]
MNNVSEIGKAPIGRLLLKFSLPTIAVMLLNGLYNVIDRIFVGQGLGTQGIAAVTAAFPLMLVSIAVGGLLGVGSSTLISIALGEKKNAEARSILGQTFSVTIAAAVVVAAATFLVMTPALRLLGASGRLLPMAREYLSIILLGFLFQIPSMGIAGALRCQGRPRASMAATAAGVVVNALLAPLFIFGFHWGLAGAAWATVASQAVAFVITVALIQDRKNLLRIEVTSLQPAPATIGRIAFIGAPVGIVNLIQTGVFAVANGSVAVYGGGLGIAMVGIVNTVYLFASFPVQGISQGAQAIWGFNYGAGNYARVRALLWMVLGYSTAVSLLLTGVIEFFPRTLVSVFISRDAKLLSLGAHGLSIFFLGFVLFGLNAATAQFFLAIGKPAHATLLLVTRNGLLIAGMVILPRWLGLDGVLFAGPASDILTAALSGVLLKRGLRQLGSSRILSDGVAGVPPLPHRLVEIGGVSVMHSTQE